MRLTVIINVDDIEDEGEAEEWIDFALGNAGDKAPFMELTDVLYVDKT